jgi:uncharacterized protein
MNESDFEGTMLINEWEKQFEKKVLTVVSSDDPAHDFLHFKRVVKLAKQLCAIENAKTEVVVPAAWLHDLVIVPKNNPLRKLASKLSAEEAIKYLATINYPKQFFDEIAHAIEGHSFSANLEVNTIEAKVVQDADRLDALGAIGIARCFATAGLLKRPFYSESDPFCETRDPNDSKFTVDHFYKKLFVVATTMKTQSGKSEAFKRLHSMKLFIESLKSEL